MSSFASLKLSAAAVHRLGQTVIVCALTSALAACAQKPLAQDPQWRMAGPTVNMHTDQIAPRGTARLKIEQDGRPEQMPPTVRRGRPVADDPTEPFSPNYGTVPSGRKPAPRDVGVLDERPVVQVSAPGTWAADVLPEDLPADLPADFRTAILNARR